MDAQVNNGLVPLATFAQMQGVSRAAASKWAATGKITVQRQGRRVYVDPAQASVELKSNGQRAEETQDLLDGKNEAVPKANGLTNAKLETERERAMLLRMQRLEREGALIDKDQVDREQETAARLVRKGIDAIPSHAEDILAAALEGGVIGVRKALKKMVRELEAGLSRSMSEAADQLEAELLAADEDKAA